MYADDLHGLRDLHACDHPAHENVRHDLGEANGVEELQGLAEALGIVELEVVRV